jgi:hypothetical protein
MAGTDDGKAVGGAHFLGHFRASDADREQVVDTLKAAFVQGRLTKDELDARVGQTFASQTYAELAAVTADIPAHAPPPREPARVRARRPANKKAVLWSAGVFTSIPPAMLTVAILINSDALAGLALIPMFCFFMVAIAWAMVAVGNKVDARAKNPRSRGQLPPGPRGPGRDDNGIGRQLGHHRARPEVRPDETGAELRARSSRHDRDPKTPRVIPAARTPLAGLV